MMFLRCSKLSHGSQLLRIKAIAPTMAPKSLHILDLSPSLTSFPVILSITLLQPHWPTCCYSN